GGLSFLQRPRITRIVPFDRHTAPFEVLQRNRLHELFRQVTRPLAQAGRQSPAALADAVVDGHEKAELKIDVLGKMVPRENMQLVHLLVRSVTRNVLEKELKLLATNRSLLQIFE